jgi:hypothetical protein
LWYEEDRTRLTCARKLPGGSVERLPKTAQYREKLSAVDDWDSYLLENSGLPGPRGNIELAQAVADEGDEKLFRRYLMYDAERAPANSSQEFLAFCGVLGLGRLLAEGSRELLAELRRHASDPRWRTREAVAMALQRWGRADMDALLAEMTTWAAGNWLEKRAAAAALCEPDLLRERRHVERVLQLLDSITASVEKARERTGEEFKALRKGLGYCWSVAVAAHPAHGKKAMERWFRSDDKDVCWIMRENLKKKRLARVDPTWVQKRSDRLRAKRAWT